MADKPKSLYIILVKSYLFMGIFLTFIVLSVSSFLIRELREDLPKRNLNLANAIAEEIKIFLQQPGSDIRAFSKYFKSVGYDTSNISDELERLNRYNDFCEIAFILNFKGDIVNVSSSNKDFLGLNFKNQQYFREVITREEGDIIWSDSFISSLTGDPAITLSKKSGAYVIVTQINLSKLSDIINVAEMGENSFVCCVDKNGIIIAHSNPILSYKSLNLHNMQALSNAEENRHGSFKDNSSGIKGVSSISPVSSTGWSVIIFQSADEAFGIIDRLKIFTIIMVIAAISLLMAVTFFLVKKFLNPIHTFVEQLGVVERGDYGQKLSAEYDELNPLADSFNNMFKTISSRQRDLEENRKHLNSLLTAIHYGVLEVDKEGTIIYSNPAATKILGYKPEELLGKKIWSLNKISFNRFESHFESFINHKNAKSSYTDKFIRNDGKEITVVIDCDYRFGVGSRVVGLICVISDITDNIKQDEQMAQLSKFPNENPHPVMRMSEEGEILFANRASMPVLDYWGIKEKEALPEEWSLIALQALNSNEIIIKEVKTEDRNYSFYFTPVEQFGYVNIYGIEITNMKVLENRLQQKEKLEAVGQLAGGIAHDFNNQLSGVMGYADMLCEYLEDEKLLKYARNILRSSERAADMVKKLLAFSRKGNYLSIPVDMHRLISETIDILYHSVDKKIKFRSKFDARQAVVRGDPTQLQNALLNISLNARDAMPDGGEVLIETRAVYLDEVFCEKQNYELEVGDFLQISVVDSGEGMGSELQKKIFEPFFTTKPEGKGTGMGLAAVYGTIKLHKGFINVYSELGKGSCFKIYLPLEKVESIEEEKTEEVETMNNLDLKILFVDDELTMREVGEDMLEDLGCEVVLAEDGSEAIDIYREKWQDIDLVILDMGMPNMSGKETFAEMEKINSDVKVILVSGFSVQGEAQQVLNDGAIGFIQKPFHKKAVISAIAGAVEVT